MCFAALFQLSHTVSLNRDSSSVHAARDLLTDPQVDYRELVICALQRDWVLPSCMGGKNALGALISFQRREGCPFFWFRPCCLLLAEPSLPHDP